MNARYEQRSLRSRYRLSVKAKQPLLDDAFLDEEDNRCTLKFITRRASSQGASG